jgi:galactokinase
MGTRRSSFQSLFGFAAQTSASAPGRANLLGEHTDYNEGFVLPVTVRQRTEVELAVSPDRIFRFHSENLGETVAFEREPPHAGFAPYLYGCIEVLRLAGHAVKPVTLFVRSDVPIGAGLSSSAALEVAALRGLRSLFGLSIDDVALARFAQSAEVDYAGVRCGVLDQMAVSLGERGNMLFLDTRTLERRLVPLPPGSAVVVIDSGVRRELSSTHYNQRRAECERAALALGVRALRDVTDVACAGSLPAPLDRRARHVITENARVLQGASGVDARIFGALMNASHASLRDDYEVSITALDQLAQALRSHPAVYGARLMGAGFGGACVALVEAEAAERVKHETLATYDEQGFRGRALV